MARVLIIACGNLLRGDDGLAWHAAELIRQDARPEVEILCSHQLTPEFAEPASRAQTVIFMDASLDGEAGIPRWQAISLQPGQLCFSHQLEPAQVIALANTLYGASPKAFAVSLRGICFDHGESLSPEVMRALPAMAAQVRRLIERAILPAA
jgi:hydrogenase maturation protease